MPTVRASALVLLAATVLCAASCDGSSSQFRRARAGAGAAGRLANAMGGEGGEGGVVDAPRAGSSGKSSGGTRPGSGGSGAHPNDAGRGGTRASGGTGATAASAGSGGTLGVGRGGTQNGAGDAGTAGLAGAGGAGTLDQLSLCVRLGSSSTALDERVTLDFENAFYDDCRVSWVFGLYYDESKNLDDRYQFLTQVGRFNYSLWGCALSSPPDGFDLIYTPEPLTRADANALIDAYVGAASKDLSMSPDEIAAMRAILVRLSEPLLMSPDPGGFSQSRCNTTGGAGGAGGEGGGAGDVGQAGRGSGGEPSNGQAGTGQAGAG